MRERQWMIGKVRDGERAGESERSRDKGMDGRSSGGEKRKREREGGGRVQQINFRMYLFACTTRNVSKMEWRVVKDID